MKQTLIIVVILIIAVIALQWLKKNKAFAWLGALGGVQTGLTKDNETGGPGQKGTDAGGLPEWFYR
jgi:hypothetical protein